MKIKLKKLFFSFALLGLLASCDKELIEDSSSNPKSDFSQISGKLKGTHVGKTYIRWGRPSKNCYSLGFCYAESTSQTTITYESSAVNVGSDEVILEIDEPVPNKATFYFENLGGYSADSLFFGNDEMPLEIAGNDFEIFDKEVKVLPGDYNVITQNDTLEYNNGDDIWVSYYKVVVDIE